MPTLCLLLDISFNRSGAQGSKVLRGDDRSYIISPMASIIDERYTVCMPSVLCERYSTSAHAQ